MTPGYAMGFTRERELPIVWKIALGSLRGLVKSMPHLLKGLSAIGTAAMLWVGGAIVAVTHLVPKRKQQLVD